jgi:hypothetical protein
MKSEDFAFYQPYGLMTGAHVTPIDHGYFNPTIFNSARDTYPVRALADTRVVDIQHRTSPVGRGNPNGRPTDEYRLIFSYTCTFLSYYDLVTSLAGDVKTAYEKDNGQNIDVQVKAGDVIGYIGGQTLDFAVWDTTKPLTGFIVPEHYQAEGWKIYTANPFDYMSDDLKALMISKDLRKVEPLQGKIDYDVDGKLIGTWFIEGTNGYAGTTKPNYWISHLVFAPNFVDPTTFTISTGDFNGNAAQFGAKGNAPDPATVSVSTGLVKYDLVNQELQPADNRPWNSTTYAGNLKMKNQDNVLGCVLVQLSETRKLKEETFPGKACSTISTFDSAAKTYER